MKTAYPGERVIYDPMRHPQDKGVGKIIELSHSGKTAKVAWPYETTYCKLQSLRREVK